VVMIQQMTDGLSRGVWASALHQYQDQHKLTTSIFAPAKFDENLVKHILHSQGNPTWRYQDWNSVWHTRNMFGFVNVWFPPPEIARQAITFTLEAWVEQPSTTGALFVVPRVVPAFWHGLSRHIQELPMLSPLDPWCPLQYPPLLPIPLIILYLPPFARSLPTVTADRMGPLTHSRDLLWHTQQAEHVRGLSPRRLDF